MLRDNVISSTNRGINGWGMHTVVFLVLAISLGEVVEMLVESWKKMNLFSMARGNIVYKQPNQYDSATCVKFQSNLTSQLNTFVCIESVRECLIPAQNPCIESL